MVHLELHTRHPQDASRFYADLCGWRQEHVHTSAGSYRAVELGSQIGGGIVGCPISHPLWLPYVEVHDIREASDLAQRLGAQVMLAPREGPGGWRSVVATSAAGELALWQPKR